MIKIIDGNLLDTKARIIAHQVNCQGEMKSGVAKAIREKYPVVYHSYKKCENKRLGHIHYVYCGKDQSICIANMFAQYKYGYDGREYTDLVSLKYCFKQLDVFANTLFICYGWIPTIAMPYKIGCGLGGANWDEVYKLIEEIFTVDVELWRLEQ